MAYLGFKGTSKVLTPFKYDYVWLTGESFIDYVVTNVGGRADKNGNIIGGKYGVVDQRGELVPPKYDEISLKATFYPEYPIPVKRNGKWGFLNNIGQECVRPQYDAVTNFGDLCTLAEAITILREPYYAGVYNEGGKVKKINSGGLGWDLEEQDIYDDDDFCW